MKPCEALRIARQTESRPSSHPCVRIYARWKVWLGDPCPLSWVANTYASMHHTWIIVAKSRCRRWMEAVRSVRRRAGYIRNLLGRDREGGAAGMEEEEEGYLFFLGFRAGYSCPYSI